MFVFRITHRNPNVMDVLNLLILRNAQHVKFLGTVGAHVRNQSGSCIELNAKPLPDLVKKDENHSHLLYD